MTIIEAESTLSGRHQAKASDDPALAAFLALLDARMAQRPEAIAPYTDADAEADLTLVEGVALD